MTELIENKCQVLDDKTNKLSELLEYDVKMLKDIIVKIIIKLYVYKGIK